MKKKLIGLTLVSVLLASNLSFNAFSSMIVDSSTKNNSSKTISALLSKTTYKAPSDTTPKTIRVKDELYENMYTKDGKLDKIDGSKLKAALMQRLNTTPMKYKFNMKDIHSMVDEFYLQASLMKGYNLFGRSVTFSPKLFRGSTWVVKPYVIASENWVTYSDTWIIENNYNCGLPVSVSYTQTESVNQTVGFTGSTSIKTQLGFSWSSAITSNSSLTQGTTIPFWNIWGRRPYIDFRKDFYIGELEEYYYDLASGEWVYCYTWPTGENDTCTAKAIQYWSQVNLSQDPYTAAPVPPAGQPY